MKRFIGLLSAVSVAVSCTGAVSAADKSKGEPDVFVDGSRIIFEDQNAVIVDDITLVPARGVFEAMGNDVIWNGDDRTVTVISDTGVREVLIKIDSDIMKVSTYKTLFERSSEDVELEVPAQIINERTMIPLRAVSEAFDCDVDWDGDEYVVNIRSGAPVLMDGYEYEEPDESSRTGMSLSTTAQDVGAGEEFEVSVNASNIPEGSYVSSVVATFEYDHDEFEYISGTLIGEDGEPLAASVSAENGEYETGAKTVFITVDDEAAKRSDGTVFTAKFRKLTDKSASIALGNAFNSLIGYESYLGLTVMQDDEDLIISGKDLALDMTPIVID